MKHAQGEARTESPIRWKLVTSVLVASTLVTAAILYQLRVDEAWSDLPAARVGDVESMASRLEAVDALLDRYPAWWGAQRAVRERTRLSTQIQVLKTERVVGEAERSSERELQRANAVSARREGMSLAQTGDYAAALVKFEEALEAAPEDWEEREKVQSDVESIHEWLRGEEGEQE